MWIESLILLPVAVLFFVIGLLIWKKQMISLIHSYHCDKVSEENRPAYTALFGKGICLIGAAIALTAVIDLVTESGWGWIAFGCGFTVGMVLVLRAIIRYNR